MTDGIIRRFNESDNIAVALKDIAEGDRITLGNIELKARDPIKKGHKIALTDVAKNEDVIKYGNPIGHAIKDIARGEHVHLHNLATNLKGQQEYTYSPVLFPYDSCEPRMFSGYIRENGEVGSRNEIWIVPTVGCVNRTAETLAREANRLFGDMTGGIFSFSHPYGCSQLGEDQLTTQKTLAGMVRHPNAAAVLVLGLGCENNNIPSFQKTLGEYNPDRVKFLAAQEAGDEIAEGLDIIRQLVRYASGFKRQPCPVSKLIIGLKCGGSDAFSGITANPLLGAFSDILIGQGGACIMTEVPEMFGAERILMNRCANGQVFNKVVKLINDFKLYYIRYGQEIYENPSPGNKEGGITTLEEKSLGGILKGGTTSIEAVLYPGDRASSKGLNLLYGPGNDPVSTTQLMSSGAQVILFTTGRGTPFGTSVPTVKVSSNTELFMRKRNWIDFDAGPLLTGGDLRSAAHGLFDFVIKVASGEIKTRNEENCFREIAIFKDGATL